MMRRPYKSQLSYYDHGGNVHHAARSLGLPVNRIIDFSASINPLGLSGCVKSVIRESMRKVVHYPDPDATELRNVIAEYHGIPADNILCGNGSTDLIYLLPRILKPASVLLTAPTFSEYERACSQSQELRVKSYELREEDEFKIMADEFISAIKENSKFKIQDLPSGRQGSKLSDGVGSNGRSLLHIAGHHMAFLCNPNNPTGHLLKRDTVLKIADAARDMRCYLVVDEAFIDFIPEESVIVHVKDNPYLIVLRSMTKFYALTGLRVGYGVFHKSIMKSILTSREPWSVNIIAQEAAIAAIKDHDYASRTFRLISEEKQFMEEGFRRLGVKFFPSAANYYLLKMENAGELIGNLYEQGILVRDCSNFSGLDESFIRVAVRIRSENELLIKEMERVCRA